VNSEQQETAILVIDDEESLRNTFQFFLQNQGYGPVHTAASYEEALQALSERSYDLIISDIVLGGHTGIDVLKYGRELGLLCPMVMITGYPTVETAAEAVRLGAFDYIPKPVDKEAPCASTSWNRGSGAWSRNVSAIAPFWKRSLKASPTPSSP
jgi:DNA-binding NtrC family response regulator